MIFTFANPALCAPCDSIYSTYLSKCLNSSHVGRNTCIFGICDMIRFLTIFGFEIFFLFSPLLFCIFLHTVCVIRFSDFIHSLLIYFEEENENQHLIKNGVNFSSICLLRKCDLVSKIIRVTYDDIL